MERTYTIVLTREEVGGYSVSVPALKGCHTQGDTLAEALFMAEDAVRLYVESLEARGEAVPRDCPGMLVSPMEIERMMVSV